MGEGLGPFKKIWEGLGRFVGGGGVGGFGRVWEGLEAFGSIWECQNYRTIAKNNYLIEFGRVWEYLNHMIRTLLFHFFGSQGQRRHSLEGFGKVLRRFQWICRNWKGLGGFGRFEGLGGGLGPFTKIWDGLERLGRI